MRIRCVCLTDCTSADILIPLSQLTSYVRAGPRQIAVSSVNVSQLVPSSSDIASHACVRLDILHAFNPAQTPSDLSKRLAGVLCITFSFIIHGTRPRWGIFLQDTLGVLKIIALGSIALSGLASLAGVPGFAIPDVSCERSNALVNNASCH